MNETKLLLALPSRWFIILATLCFFELFPGNNAFVAPPKAGIVSGRNSIGGGSLGKIHTRSTSTGLKMDMTSQAEQFISILLSDSTTSTGAATGDVVTSSPPDFSPFGQGTRGLSYYSTLALYALSFPGLWSTIQRSTTTKVKQKTYVSPSEEDPEGGKTLRQQAGEIMAYMKANNYEISDNIGETITFRGIVARSTSQAFFLTFCTALALASLALVLQIQFIDLELFGTKINWFYLVLLSPYAGLYYWKSGDRVDEVKVKLLQSDENPKENEIIIQGPDEELERMWRALSLVEKGMIKVEGILSRGNS